MADPTFAPIGDEPADDLPRTFRREKEAREREARERAARERAAAPTLSTAPEVYPAQSAPSPKIYAEPTGPVTKPNGAIGEAVVPAVVRRIDVPFFDLVKFFLKAVVAAIPALILLMVILWGLGQALELLFPDIVRMKILIGLGS